MKAFTSLAVLAISVAALELKESETIEVVTIQESGEYFEEIDMLPDAEVAVAMVQGSGRDHTDWSWHWENKEAEAEARIAVKDVKTSVDQLAGAVVEYENVLSQTLSPQVEFQRSCQLHREEEINLYYQCTQNDINNYALHHFGGDMRSYPRWVEEYNVCIDHVHSAKVLHLDFHWSDGTVTVEPCDPQDHSNSVYIGTNDIKVGGWFQQEVTVITANPLQPEIPCEQQNIPNWGGLWVETHGKANEASDILMGNIVLDDKYTMRCYSIEKTEKYDTAKMVETWDEVSATRTYDVTLRKDPRNNGCMVHTALHGTAFTQWLGAVDGLNMNSQINEEWHVTQADGSEQKESSHNEVRVGSCKRSADGTHTAEKHLIPGVRLTGIAIPMY